MGRAITNLQLVAVGAERVKAPTIRSLIFWAELLVVAIYILWKMQDIVL